MEDVLGFFYNVSELVEVSKFDFFICLVWEIWNHRNKVLSENEKWSPEALVEWTGGFLDDYREANKARTRKGCKDSVSSWPPPSPGVCAISVDAAVDYTSSRYGTGCVIRDHRGVVVASEISVNQRGFSPPLAEAAAIIRGLSLAKELEIWRVVVQSDCLQVVNAIKSKDTPSTELGILLEDIKVCSGMFLDFNILFIPRS